jgi:hypothetical protein
VSTEPTNIEVYPAYKWAAGGVGREEKEKQEEWQVGTTTTTHHTLLQLIVYPYPLNMGFLHPI